MKEKETQTRTDDGVAALLLALFPFRERVLFSLLVSSSIFFVSRARKGYTRTHTKAHKKVEPSGIEKLFFLCDYLGCEIQIQKKKALVFTFFSEVFTFCFDLKTKKKYTLTRVCEDDILSERACACTRSDD